MQNDRYWSVGSVSPGAWTGSRTSLLMLVACAFACGNGGDREGERSSTAGLQASCASPSPSCTTVTSTTGSIVDGAMNVWELAPGPDGSLIVVENGAPAGFSDYVTELAYVNGVVSQRNVSNGWWAWSNGAWNGASDPTTSCGGSSGGAGGGPCTGASCKPAVRVNGLVNTFCANHITWQPRPSAAATVDAVNYLGVKVVRTSPPLPWDVNPAYASLVANGTKFLCGVAAADLDTTIVAGGAQACVDAFGVSNIVGFEGPNECGGGGSGWHYYTYPAHQDTLSSGQNAREFMVEMRDDIRNNVPAAANVPIVEFSQWVGGDLSRNDQYSQQVGDLSGIVDRGNWHSYNTINGFMIQPWASPNGPQAAANRVQMTVPGQRFAITEFGVSPVGQAYEQASPDAGGKMLLNHFLDFYVAGSFLSCVFETFDWTGEGFGLFTDAPGDAGHATVRQRAATYIHNFTTIVRDTGASADTFPPASLDYTLTGVPSNGRHLLLNASNGDFFIVLWNEDDVQDGAGNDVTPNAVPVTLSVAKPVSRIEVYDPAAGTAAVDRQGSPASSVTVNLYGYPKIIRIAAQ